MRSYRPGVNDENRRLDRVLRKFLPGLPLSRVYSLLRKGLILVNGRYAAGDYRLKTGDEIAVPEDLVPVAGSTASLPAGTGDLPSIPASWILFEDNRFLVLNKPAGIVVHGKNSLEERVRRYLTGKIDPGLSFTPGPLHRLDRNTSGVIFFSKSLAGARAFASSMKAGLVSKIYVAVLDGEMTAPVRWSDTLARDSASRVTTVRAAGQEGREDRDPSVTRASPIAAAHGKTLALVEISGGFTHQIRAQSASHGHALTGDSKYGGSRRSGGYILHALEYSIRGEESGSGLAVRGRLPESSRRAVEALFGGEAVSREDL
jgi:23S rRNA pseudouridine955/2504/2580 synthase